MKEKHIESVRAFNRFYTVFIGVLNKSYLNSKHTFPEGRVLQAIYLHPGITPSEIIAMLHIDKSYLSRIIMTLEKQKVITRKKTASDGRVINLFTTALGKTEFEKLDEASNNLVKNHLSDLSDKDCDTLVKCMTQIRDILSAASRSTGTL